MKIFAGIFSKFFKSSNNHDKTDYIFYKIVDSIQDDNIFVLQCVNAKTTFYASLTDIVFDLDILYGLHPIQACYIGIEYSKNIKNLHQTTFEDSNKALSLNKQSVHRYGKYRLAFQNREGNICFINDLNNEEFLMDPRDVALSKKIIEEFDSSQAFYVGILAGLKINNDAQKFIRTNIASNRPTLRVVK